MPTQPKDTPIIQKPTPVVLDELLIEQTDSNKALYDRMLEYGHFHPDRQKYPSYRFLKAEPTDYGGMRYYWASDLLSQDCYNASKTYSGEANAYPIFTRSYRVLRSDYLANGPSTKLFPFTGIVTTNITNQGSGYTKDFPVTFTGTGSGAAGIAIVDTANGRVVYIALTAVGSGYTSAPTVVLSAGDGASAAATAYIQPQTALLVKEEHSKLDEGDPYGSLYDRVVRTWETLPGPILSGSTIDPQSKIVTNWSKQLVASGTVDGGITGAGVIDLTIFAAGSGFTAGTYSLAFSGGGGTGAAGTYTVTAPTAGSIGALTLVTGGAGFTSIPTVAVSGGGGSGATATAALNGTPIASLTLVSSNTSFTDVPTLTISDSAGTGLGATGTCFLTGTGIASVAVLNGGSGFTVAGIVFAAPEDPAGTTALATVNLVAGVITSVTITNAGSGYSTRPSFVFTGDGTGQSFGPAVLVATSILSTLLTATGNGYQTPSVSISGGGGSASAVAAITPTSVASITLTAAGSGYSSPVVAFSGGGGTGATATAALATGSITSTAITLAGTNYTSAPTITTPSGGGTGASIKATIGSTTYVDVEPLTTVKDMVMRSSVSLASLPPAIRVPISVRVVRTDKQTTSLVIKTVVNTNSTDGTFLETDVGLLADTKKGGTGPALGFLTELWMTDSQYAAFSPGGFSSSGASTTTTLFYLAINGPAGRGKPQVWTFVPSSIQQGTLAGVYDISAERWRLGIWHVRIITIPSNY